MRKQTKDAFYRNWLTADKVAEKLTELTGKPITEDAILQRAHRGKADYVKVGRHQGILLFYWPDFDAEIFKLNLKNREKM